jgi:hypothetical protein
MSCGLACASEWSANDAGRAGARPYHRKLSDVTGPENPDTLSTCFDLAVCLRSESEIPEDGTFARRAAEGALRVLGPENPNTKKYEQLQR